MLKSEEKKIFKTSNKRFVFLTGARDI